MRQPALDQGILLDWTKGFECMDVVEQVCVCLCVTSRALSAWMC